MEGLINLNDQRIAALCDVMKERNCTPERLLQESRRRLEELLTRNEKAIGRHAKAAREQSLLKTWLNEDVEAVKGVLEQILRL
jgi:hypothetical protein